MKVFISWSGDAAKEISKELIEFLPLIIPQVECFQSSEGIEKGARWSMEIAKELQDTSVGILCLTSQNIEAPWIAFEAGALSKSIGEGQVAPLLFGIGPGDIAGGPLSQFQATVFRHEDVLKLIDDLGKKNSEDQRKRSQTYFEKFWPDFSEKVEGILASHSALPLKQADPVMKMLNDIRGSQQYIQNRLRTPTSFFPFLEMERAFLMAKNPKQLSVRLLDHIEELEDIISEVDNQASWVDEDDFEDLQNAMHEVQLAVSGFERLESKEERSGSE